MDYMAHSLLLQGNCLWLRETIRHSSHLEHLFICNMLANLNDQSEGKHRTVHTVLEKKQGQEIASKATGTLITYFRFNRPRKRLRDAETVVYITSFALQKKAISIELL